MAAIITDQIRILNAKNFLAGVSTSTNAYYSFIGLPNPTDIESNWDTNPPSPKDNFSEEDDYWDSMIAVKKITPADVKQIVKKNQWASGTTYDYYRQDYSINNKAPVSDTARLYDANYYVINSDFNVYICISNGSSGEDLRQRRVDAKVERRRNRLHRRLRGTEGSRHVHRSRRVLHAKPGDGRRREEIVQIHRHDRRRYGHHPHAPSHSSNLQ